MRHLSEDEAALRDESDNSGSRLRSHCLTKELLMTLLRLISYAGMALCLWHTLIGHAVADDPQATRVGAHVSAVLRDEKQAERTVSGRVLVKAADGGLLLEAADGKYWTAPAKHLQSVTALETEFRHLKSDELKATLERELAPLGLTGKLSFVSTERYLVATNGNAVVAEWAGKTLEKLQSVFHEYWQQYELKLTPTEQPLVVLVFASQAEFAKYGVADGNPLATRGTGYYSMTTNRIALFDFLSKPGSPPLRTTTDAQRVSAANPAVLATLLHEGVHQVAYNSGLHQRYSDAPVWLTEGMANVFETVDLQAKDAAKAVGKSNPARLKQYRLGQKGRASGEWLASLLQSNERFAQPDDIPHAYAEAWALTYHLLKTQPTKYVEFLQLIQSKPLLQWDSKEERAAEFRSAFGDIDALQKQMKRAFDR